GDFGFCPRARLYAFPFHQRCITDGDPVSVNAGDDTTTFYNFCVCDLAVYGITDFIQDGPGQRMVGFALHACKVYKRPVDVLPEVCLFCNFRVAKGQRACLVKNYRIHPAESAYDFTALEKDAVARTVPYAGDVGNGDADHQGAGTAEDEDRYGQFRRSEEHTSELQSRENLVCRLLLEKKKAPAL